MASFPGPEPASAFVCNVALAGADPVLFTEYWWTAGGEAGALHLAAFLEAERETPNPFWEKEPCRAAWMKALLRDRSLELLRRAAERHGAGPHAGLLSSAQARLRRKP